MAKQANIVVIAQDLTVVDVLSDGLRHQGYSWTITAVQPGATLPLEEPETDLIVVQVDDDADRGLLLKMIQRVRANSGDTPIVAFGKRWHARRMTRLREVLDGVLVAPTDMETWLAGNV